MSAPATRQEFDDLLPPGFDYRPDWIVTLAGELNAAVASGKPVGAVVADPADLEIAAQALAEWADAEPSGATSASDLLAKGLLHWVLRPSLRIRATPEGTRPDATGPLLWDHWSATIDALVERDAASVGRLDLVHSGRRIAQGTAWVAAHDGDDWVLVTAGHVIRTAYELGWGTNPAVEAVVDFGCLDADGLAITIERGAMHADLDLGTVRIPVRAAPALRPLAIASSAPTPLDGTAAMVIGHPLLIGAAQAEFANRTLGFDGRSGVKRASPGKLRTLRSAPPIGAHGPVWRTAFAHDATTLGGSSGSPVFDLQRRAVVGVHVGGRPVDNARPRWFIDNFALPSWTLPVEVLP